MPEYKFCPLSRGACSDRCKWYEDNGCQLESNTNLISEKIDDLIRAINRLTAAV